MMQLRLWHTYIGFFIAPSVLFFALTGSLQLFSLHEAHGSYQPPALIEKLSSVHKDQVFRAKAPQADHPAGRTPHAATGAAHPDHADRGPRLGTYLLKWFFLVVALGLVVSTALGLWFGFTHVRRRRTALLLLAVGAVIPVALLFI